MQFLQSNYINVRFGVNVLTQRKFRFVQRMEIFHIPNLWHCLDGTSAISLALCCRTSLAWARLYRPVDLILAQNHKQICRFLNALDYARFRLSCSFLFNCLPQNQLVKQLVDDWPKEREWKPKKYGKFVRLALEQDEKWTTVDTASLSIEPGENIAINRRFFYSFQAVAALAGITFSIPAGQRLEAKVKLGGSDYFNYCLEASEVVTEFYDEFFTRPLVYDNIWWQNVELTTNCPAVIHYTAERPKSEELMHRDFHAAYVTNSPFVASFCRISAGLGGMTCWIYSY